MKVLIPGIAGIHLMAARQESAIGEMVAASGVLDGRRALFAASPADDAVYLEAAAAEVPIGSAAGVPGGRSPATPPSATAIAG